MRLGQRQQNSGFTIIEVMIVVVIAAVIMLVVFLAVPALQRAARNRQRVADATLLVQAIQECFANSRSITFCSEPENLPLDSEREFAIYKGFHYGHQVVGNTSHPPTRTEPNWRFGIRCNTNGGWFLGGGGSERPFVVTYLVEPFDTSKCIDGSL